MKEKKQKFPLWIYPSTMETIERYLEKSECRSKSDFIEKAILFYAGFLAAQNYQNYIPNVMISCIKGSLGTFERRTSNILFKVAVELSMMNFLLASAHRVSKTTMEDLCNMCIRMKQLLTGRPSTWCRSTSQEGNGPTFKVRWISLLAMYTAVNAESDCTCTGVKP